ncbi:MAG TPA: potassium channel protein [Chitinophagaceae bacterium]|nr:potassium channel protein [Chitinophagaceae bacterium]
MRLSTFRLLQPFIILHIIIGCGIIGYMVIENASLIDALFMTTISITTVGYDQTVPLSETGKIFTIILLITSWGTFAFAISRITQFVVNGEINKYFKNRRLMKEIDKLDNHVIICGYGRNGHESARILKSHGIPFIIIEKNPALIVKADQEEDHLLHLEGDSTNDAVLLFAGVKKARALITTLPVDADNLFIVLSARELNPTIQIVSRASDSNSIAKLKKAGANNVIMPDRIGGTHMATLISKPDVVEFIDFLSGEEGQSVNIESVSYEQLPAELRGKPLDQVMNWNKSGVNCIGIKSAEGKFQINPPEDLMLYPGMKIIVLGTRNQILRMKANLG